MANNFNYDDLRSLKARIGVGISRSIIILVQISAVALSVGGIALVATSHVLGWLLVGFSALPMMLIEWKKGELDRLPVTKKDSDRNTIHGVAEAALLGRLKPQDSGKSLALAAVQTKSGMFLARRLGISAQFLSDLVPDDVKVSDLAWDFAFGLRSRLGVEYVNGGMVIAGLVRQVDQIDQILAQFGLEQDDIIKALEWQIRSERLAEKFSRKFNGGGLGRDLSFGYTPYLSRFGQNITNNVLSQGGVLRVELEAHQQILDMMISQLSGGGRQNVALIGAAGSGKTAIVEAFSELIMENSPKIPSNLKYRQVVMLDAAALVSAAPGRGELEQLVNILMNEAYRAKNIILYLDNAQLFFQEGVGSVDISSLLIPILEAGRLRMILAVGEQEFLQISQRNTGILNALNRISVQPANQEETIRILQDKLVLFEYQKKVHYMFQAIEEAYSLSQRYIHELAMPGRALKLLESAGDYADNGLVTAKSVQDTIEKTLNIKVGTAKAESEVDTLLNLEQLIHERMIGQERAVRVISDSLRRARAGVRSQTRPIGTFLFLGPTGVGKTELSKALADVYFGGEDRIVRIDLNEFVQPSDVMRLIADPTEFSGSLTAQMMKQPFSVVLLDEIEKAHPQVLTTLLQVLDEGILRDSQNREISFRDSIIIATSNAGADRIREYVERGYKLEQFEQQFTDELIASNQFRPEFLNRFDEIVVFSPLGPPELIQIINLMINSVNKTLSSQKVKVEVEDEAKQLLVSFGYDPRLGARPMRRVVQRAIENTVAKQMLAGQAGPGTTIVITAQQVQEALSSS